MISVVNWYSERAIYQERACAKTKTNGQTLCGGAMQATVVPIANCLRLSHRSCGARHVGAWRQPVDQSEDIVQDILLAVHLKRHTWDADALFLPLFAIARNKLVDALRRRGRRVFVNINDFTETIASEPVAETVRASEVTVHLKGLPKRQRDVLQSITVESNSIKATAVKLAMSEGAVRVALHRGLARLAAKLRNE
jgi:RNA polymerase sigma-70 factor, ECF subfamily